MGVYREWVKPANGGLSDSRRITYAAAPGEHVTITGAEQITGWTHEAGPVWSVTLPNAMFGDHNPYARPSRATGSCGPPRTSRANTSAMWSGRIHLAGAWPLHTHDKFAL